ncbi:MAG: LysR family transcriptional regulator [Clostridia bacterium]|nr:LysR family transcriptional regulator [Clostridia bacterium]
MINLKHISAVMAVVQEGSFTAASKKLFISQPALSQTIKQAENDLGAPIFNRLSSPVELTYAGKIFVDSAQQILMIDHNLHAMVAAAKGEIFDRFFLGVSMQRSQHLLPAVIPEFIRMYPHVRLVLQEETSMTLERMTLEKQCDLALVTSDAKRSQLEYLSIQNEHLVLIASKSAPISKRIADGSPIDITEAAHEHFISMCAGHSIRILQDLLFEQNNISPEILLETHNMETAKRLTSKTDAVFLLPDSYLAYDHEQFPVNVYPLRVSGPSHPFYACYLKKTELTPYAKDMIRIICRHMSVPCPIDS